MKKKTKSKHLQSAKRQSSYILMVLARKIFSGVCYILHETFEAHIRVSSVQIWNLWTWISQKFSQEKSITYFLSLTRISFNHHTIAYQQSFNFGHTFCKDKNFWNEFIFSLSNQKLYCSRENKKVFDLIRCTQNIYYDVWNKNQKLKNNS